jgi:hypothetical protein
VGTKTGTGFDNHDAPRAPTLGGLEVLQMEVAGLVQQVSAIQMEMGTGIEGCRREDSACEA